MDLSAEFERQESIYQSAEEILTKIFFKTSNYIVKEEMAFTPFN